MSNFWLRQLGEYDPSTETIEETLERVITTTNKNIDQLKHMLWGNITSANVREIDADLVTVKNLVVGENVDGGDIPQIFYSQPVVPYRLGDIWLDGVDLWKAVVTKETGVFDAADWELGTNYTNPTGVTTIVNGVVTTDYVNALAVVAGSVAAENITGNVITGKTIRTSFSGERLELTTSDNLVIYSNNVAIGGLHAYSGTVRMYSSDTIDIVSSLNVSSGLVGGGISLNSGTAVIQIFKLYNQINLSAGLVSWPQGGSGGDTTIATRGWVAANYGNVTIPANTGYAGTGNTGSHTTASHNHGFGDTHYIYVKVGTGGTPYWAVWQPYSGQAHVHTGPSHRHTI